ncbi:MAG: hypothetical protein ABI718_14735, partial [Acidobacteriota bacterium]
MRRPQGLPLAYILVLACLAGRANAGVPVFIAPNATGPIGAPAGQERYIVALQSQSRANQLALAGGSVEREAGLFALVSVPAAALDGLRHNPKVRYIQRVLPPSEAADLLRTQKSTPGPAVGASSVSFNTEPDAISKTTSSATSHPTVSATSIAPSLVTAPMSTTVWDSGTYSYDGAGNIMAMGGGSYTYDKVSRLVQSTTMSGGSGRVESYIYDAFGNMTSKTTNGAPLSIPVNVYTNRMNGASYDIAGNVTWDGVHTFQYDPFGQPREISESGGLVLYPIYDADGERIGLVTEGSNEWKWTPRDLGGKVAREYLGAGGSVGQPGNFFY